MKDRKGRRVIVGKVKRPSLPEEMRIIKSDEDGPKVKPPFANRGSAGVGGMSRVKSRKELRKELRKAKKSQKHQYLLAKCGREDLVKQITDGIEGKGKKKRKKKKNKKKPGNKTVEVEKAKKNEGKDNGRDGDDLEESSDTDQEEDDKRFVEQAVKNHLEKKETVDLAEELKVDKKKMKKEMDEVRRKRLLEENEEEERTINQLSKKLKLNKKAGIPSSFRTDGLDFILELCEKSGKGKKSNDDEDEVGSDDEDDQGEDNLGMEEGGSDIGKDSLSGEEEEEDMDMNEDEQDDTEEEEASDEENAFDNLEEDEDISDADFNDQSLESDDDDVDASKKSNKSTKNKKSKEEDTKEDDGVWEDIYGRLRLKDGTVIHSRPDTDSNKSDIPSSQSKYVPPALRGNQSQQEKLTRQLKGLLNRLSENNMHSIASQIEEMYMTNSRNEVNKTLLDLLMSALVRPAITPDRVILEHAMLIAIMHANVGTEVGAFFIQSFTQDFKSKYDSWNFLSGDDENKSLENLVQIISYIYHFKIIGSGLIYDVLKFLGDSFRPKDVELILTILKSVGFRLRKDDPARLKELIVSLQEKASKLQSGDSSSAKVKFMLEILMAIRNNNMSKIPNFDPSFGEHLQKILKSHLHAGNYVSEMNIGLQDLLNANMAGRWWIVGSAWSGKDVDQNNSEVTKNSSLVNSVDAEKRAKLMKRARAQGMNTDTRRNIFCILMTAEDFMDAFEKLNHLGLRNNQDREIMHVTSYCCFQEKKFNPYYAFILSKFCSSDRKLMLALQFSLWDRLKDLSSLSNQQRINLAHLLVHLINDKSLSLSTLKVIEYAEMDKIKLKFLKTLMTGILLQKEVENLQEIFIKPALSEKLSLFRESLRLFLNHFMLKSLDDGKETKLTSDETKLLKQRIKIAEKCFTSSFLK